MAAALAFPAVASAQAVSDVLSINYFDNAHSALPDGKVRISSPGTGSTVSSAGTVTGDLCAMIYVFRPDQQMAECCGCKVTPNALLKLSVNDNLTSNPLTGGTLTAGAIKILSAAPNVAGPKGSSKVCDAGSVVTPPVPTPTLRAWGTHIDDSGTITETEFLAADLSGTEFVSLVLGCSFIEGTLIPPGLGSGAGTCDCTNQLTGAIDP
jgi:hypothetical protein